MNLSWSEDKKKRKWEINSLQKRILKENKDELLRKEKMKELEKSKPNREKRKLKENKKNLRDRQI